MMRYLKFILSSCVAIILFIGTVHALPLSGTGTLSVVSDELSNPVPSASSVQHTFTFSTATSSPINKIEITFHDATNTPASPAAYLATAPTLATQSVWSSGTMGITVNGGGKEVILTRTEGAVAPVMGPVQVVLQNITNAATQGNYYVTIATMNGSTYVDSAVLVFVLNPALPVQVIVPAQLSVTVSDNGIKDNSSDDTTDPNVTFGNLGGGVSSNTTTGGGIDGNALSVTTNAQNGYTIGVMDQSLGFFKNGTTPVVGDRSTNDSTNPTNNVIFDYQGALAPVSNTEAYTFQVTGAHLASGLQNFNALQGITPVQIVSHNAPISNDVHTIMYRAQVHTITPTGTYGDILTYVVTPSF